MARNRQAVIRVDWRGPAVQELTKRETAAGLADMAELVYSASRGTLARAVRRRTGRLVASGYWATEKRSTYRRAMAGQKRERRPREGYAVIAYSAPHSHLIESGTRRAAARPFMRGALAQTQTALPRVFAARVRPGLRGAP